MRGRILHDLDIETMVEEVLDSEPVAEDVCAWDWFPTMVAIPEQGMMDAIVVMVCKPSPIIGGPPMKYNAVLANLSTINPRFVRESIVNGLRHLDEMRSRYLAEQEAAQAETNGNGHGKPPYLGPVQWPT